MTTVIDVNSRNDQTTDEQRQHDQTGQVNENARPQTRQNNSRHYINQQPQPASITSQQGTTMATNNTTARTVDHYFIDVENDRYPFCVVWTPIPLITWLLPFVGHMGICDSYGVIHDFAGPYFISRDNLAFGRPAKYWCLHPSQTSVLDQLMGNTERSVVAPVVTEKKNHQKCDGDSVRDEQSTTVQGPPAAPALSRFTAADMWDAGVYRAADMYRKQMYNFFCNNCHSYVACALEQGEAFGQSNPSGQQGGNTSASPSSGGSSASATAVGVTSRSVSSVVGGSTQRNPSSSPMPANSVSVAAPPPSVVKLKTWNMVTLAVQVFLFGKYVSVGRFLAAHLPFFIIVAMIVGFTYLGKSV